MTIVIAGRKMKHMIVIMIMASGTHAILIGFIMIGCLRGLVMRHNIRMTVIEEFLMFGGVFSLLMLMMVVMNHDIQMAMIESNLHVAFTAQGGHGSHHGRTDAGNAYPV